MVWSCRHNGHFGIGIVGIVIGNTVHNTFQVLIRRKINLDCSISVTGDD